MASIRVGTAGWVYEPWRGTFYPQGLKQKEELSFAGRALTAIELNGTFYSNQKPESFQAWASQVPDDFVFPVKGHQRVTHILRLKNAKTAVANFLASGVLSLGARLGPLVWQLPPNMKFDAERLETFLAMLPRDPDAAARLASEHDDALKSAPFTSTTGISAIRHAIEARHESFADPAFIALLRQYGVAMVIADTADWPHQDLSADFVYARLQGPPTAPSYSAADLDDWAARFRHFAAGGQPEAAACLAPPGPAGAPRDVFAFFVSNDKEHAPHNAMAIIDRIKG